MDYFYICCWSGKCKRRIHWNHFQSWRASLLKKTKQKIISMLVSFDTYRIHFWRILNSFWWYYSSTKTCQSDIPCCFSYFSYVDYWPNKSFCSIVTQLFIQPTMSDLPRWEIKSQLNQSSAKLWIFRSRQLNPLFTSEAKITGLVYHLIIKRIKSLSPENSKHRVE